MRVSVYSRPPAGRRRGFTLIEIMVVIVIIGLLSALVGPRLIGQSDEAKRKTTATQIAQLEQVLGLFQLDNGFYPTTEQGLEALVKEPRKISLNTKGGTNND